VKNLGITIESDLSFHSHINQCAFIRSKLITKCFVSCNIPTLMWALSVYVRQLVEYASSVWSTYRIELIKKVESVQRKFTKWLPGFRNLDYKTRLARLGLDSLEIWRLRQDLIYTYKVVFCLTDDTSSDFFLRLSSGHMTRGHYFLMSIALTWGNSFLVNE